MDDNQSLCIHWHDHQSTLVSVFDKFLENGTFADCTLAADGRFFNAHKIVLSACSPYFAAILSQQYDKHPVFILKDIKFQELQAMMDYMYKGKVNTSENQLCDLLQAAKSLQIRGLSESLSDTKQNNDNIQNQPVPESGTAIENNPELVENFTGPKSRKRKMLEHFAANDKENHHQLPNSSEQFIHTEMAGHDVSKKDVEESQSNYEEKNAESYVEPSQRQKPNEEVSHTKETVQFTHSGLSSDSNREHHNGQGNAAVDLSFSDEESEEESLEDLDEVERSGGGEGFSQGTIQFIHSGLSSNSNREHCNGQGNAVVDMSLSHEDSETQSLEDLDEVERSGDAKGLSQGNAQLENCRDGAAQETAEQHYDAQDWPSSDFVCDCGPSYKCSTELNRHVEFECNKNTSFPCAYCNFVFKRKWNLERHLLNFHSNEIM